MTTISKLFLRADEKIIKLGLENMQAMDKTFGYPSQTFPSVHIAGTNGKGSVATKLATSLQLSGLKVGLFTSPHISSVRERIQVDGQMIPEKKLETYLDSIFDLEFVKPTFFEIIAMTAFRYFAEEKVDVAVVEVGMGGRLDATNIVNPLLSIITTIDFDHTQYLGTTLEEIAQEKAGIIKPKVPVVLGPQAKPLSVFQTIAQVKEAALHRVQGSFTDFDGENRAIAEKALQLLPFSCSSAEGLAVRPPCRFEVIQKKIPIILDVAHNPSGLRALFRKIELHFPRKPIRALVALSADKEIETCVRFLSERTTFLHLTQAPNSRAASAKDFAQFVKSTNISFDPDTSSAFEQAYKRACMSQEILLVCGSFYLMEEVKLNLAVKYVESKGVKGPSSG